MPDFFEVLRTRRSVRSFSAEPVSRQDLQALIDSAIVAPTGMNLQPWAFTVATDRDVLQKVNSIVVNMLHSPEVQQHLTSEPIKQIVNAPGYDIFYGAPALIVICGDSKVPGALFDCQLAAENLLLAAHAKGLGACYMGFLLLAAENPEVQKLLQLVDGSKMMAAAVVGHPGSRPEGPPQRNPARVKWVS
jgi:nitroreductase